MEVTVRRYRRYRMLIFGVLAFAYLFVYFHRQCAAVVAVDMMADLKTGGTLLGLLAAAYFYPYAVMQLPAGLLSDSWGPRRTIALFFLLAAVGSIILGSSGTVFTAIAGRTLVGMGVAMLFVPTMKILAEWFTPREFAAMTGVLVAVGGIGTLTATSPLAYLSASVGWRLSFVITGMSTFAVAGLVWILVRNRPADMGFPSVATAVEGDGGAPGLVAGVVKVLSHPPFWSLAIWFFFNSAVFFSFGGLWGGPYVRHVYGMSRAESGNFLSMLAVGMIIGSPALSFLSDRVFRARKPVIVLCAALSLGVTGALAFFTADMPVAVLYAVCLAMGLLTNAIVVIGFTATKELFPASMAGTSTGLVNLFPFAGGALFQPVLGYLIERRGKIGDAFTLDGYRDAFVALFACSIIALIASLFMKETMKR